MKPCPFKYKFLIFLLFIVAYGIFYLYPNFFAPWPARMLPLLSIDRATPFLPWTFIIYTSDYYLILFVIFLIKDKKSFNVYAWMSFGTLFICGVFFLLFPTIYPRPDYPVNVSWPIRFLMELINLADSPKNCFPSMHVSLTGIAVWNLRDRSYKVISFFCFWAILIFISTLTTKQHYFMDIIGGIGVIIFVVSLEKLYSHFLFKKGGFTKSQSTP